MNMMFKAFAKKLFGEKYERLIKTLLICMIVFSGLRISGFRIQIAPVILYLTVFAFTTGVMWQALCSHDNTAYMQNMLMVPFDRNAVVFSYITALGTYTLLTKTAVLLAVLLAVTVWNAAKLMGIILCAVNAVLMTAGIFPLRRYWYMGVLWAAAFTAVVFFGWEKPSFFPIMAAYSISAFLLLLTADGYSFCLRESVRGRTLKSHRHYSVRRYLFRYLKDHKNFLINTAIMWCVACVLPVFFGKMENMFFVPICFAILSLNTPVCILLSCDPSLEQAVRFLPGQKKAFCVPYCLFLFLCSLTADMIFLCSLQIQAGGVTGVTAATAVFFSLQSAVFSVLLEWFYPIRGWKIESDLWHHPRKYIVPAAMLLLAGVVGTVPAVIPALMILLAAEIAVLLMN